LPHPQERPVNYERDLRNWLQKLMGARLPFSCLLLGSTAFLEFFRPRSQEADPLYILYGLIGVIFLLSLAYAIALKQVEKLGAFAHLQTVIDSFLVTVILYVTGGFSSLFSFLYLVVIVYSSLLLPRRSTVLIAALCGLQFGLMVDLEYYGFLNSYHSQGNVLAEVTGGDQALYKMVIIMIACIGVALLSSFLSEQALNTRRQLRIMEQHVKRVEKMAAIGEMAAGLAHEIKNPLASITGAIELLRDEIRPDPDQDRLMQIVLREADRLSTLVGNFLLYARPPSGKPEAIDLEKTVRETAELFGKKGAVDGRIAIRIKAQPGIWIGMDAAHLKQVLWNLLINAAEAIEERGEIRIELSVTKDRQACLQVCDTGTGMPPETLKSIFDPFFTTKPSGTGLGLSIVHRILDAYGCRVDVDSTPASGTLFSVYFRQIERPDPTVFPHRPAIILDSPSQISY
jgi:two-component system sensor histidine kinase PilS (NtrC family)